MNLVNQDSNTAHDMDLKLILQEIWDHKWLITAIALLCLAFSMFISYRQVPQFKTSLLIQIEENQSRTKAVITNDAHTSLLEAAKRDPAIVQSALIKSRFILEPVIQTLNLDLIIKPEKKGWNRIFESSAKPLLALKEFQVPPEAFSQPFQIEITADKQVKLYNQKGHCLLSGPLTERLESKDKRFKLFVSDEENQALPGSFMVIKKSSTQVINELTRKLKIEDIGVKRNIGILEISLQDSNPERAVAILNEIARMTKRKDAKKKALEASKLLVFLEKQLPIAKKALHQAELALNEYRAQSGKIDIKLQTQKNLQQLADLDKQLAGLELQKIEMVQRVTPKHPEWLIINQQIQRISQEQNKLKATLNKLPERDQTAVNLTREIDVKSNLYTMLLNKIQELQVLQASTISDVRILSFANAPDASLPSKRHFFYFASLVLGFLIGCLSIFAKKLFYPKVESPDWIEKHFNLPNLAIIPYASEQTKCNRKIDDKTAKNIYPSNQEQNHFSAPLLPLLAHRQAQHFSVESLRNVRMSLHAHLSCARNNIIGILGICDGIGKTFISSNLAYLMAKAGKRVLIIDADLRAGCVHEQFNLSLTPGLTECIEQHSNIEPPIQSTSVQGLYVLTRGSYPINPSELLLSDKYRRLMKDLASQFDMLIVDTSAIFPLTDATAIGEIAATNYLVFGAKAHSPLEIEMAVKQLLSAGISLQGTVFNFYNTDCKKTACYKYYSEQKGYNAASATISS